MAAPLSRHGQCSAPLLPHERREHDRNDHDDGDLPEIATPLQTWQADRLDQMKRHQQDGDERHDFRQIRNPWDVCHIIGMFIQLVAVRAGGDPERLKPGESMVHAHSISWFYKPSGYAIVHCPAELT